MVNPETATNAEVVIPQGPNDALPDNALLEEAIVDFDRDIPEIPPAVKLMIKQRSFRGIDPADIVDRVLPQTKELTLRINRQYIEELKCIPRYLNIAVQKLSITMTIIVWGIDEIPSVPSKVAKVLRQVKDGMASAKASTVEIRFYFGVNGDITYKKNDRFTVLRHKDMKEFNIKKGDDGLYIVMPEVARLQCVFKF